MNILLVMFFNDTVPLCHRVGSVFEATFSQEAESRVWKLVPSVQFGSSNWHLIGYLCCKILHMTLNQPVRPSMALCHCATGLVQYLQILFHRSRSPSYGNLSRWFSLETQTVIWLSIYVARSCTWPLVSRWDPSCLVKFIFTFFNLTRRSTKSIFSFILGTCCGLQLLASFLVRVSRT